MRCTALIQALDGYFICLLQVARKCEDVWRLISGQPDAAWRTYACLMFATKVVAQWELIMLNNKAAFPLATVLVKVGHSNW